MRQKYFSDVYFIIITRALYSTYPARCICIFFNLHRDNEDETGNSTCTWTLYLGATPANTSDSSIVPRPHPPKEGTVWCMHQVRTVKRVPQVVSSPDPTLSRRGLVTIERFLGCAEFLFSRKPVRLQVLCLYPSNIRARTRMARTPYALRNTICKTIT